MRDSFNARKLRPADFSELPSHEAGYRMPRGASIVASDRARREEARHGSRMLYEAIERLLGRPLAPSVASPVTRSENRWRPYRRQPGDNWLPREDVLVQRLRAEGMGYGAIARHLPGRSASAVAGRLRILEASR